MFTEQKQSVYNCAVGVHCEPICSTFSYKFYDVNSYPIKACCIVTTYYIVVYSNIENHLDVGSKQLGNYMRKGFECIRNENKLLIIYFNKKLRCELRILL